MHRSPRQYIQTSGTFPVGTSYEAPRVLVADDEPQIVQVLTRILRGAGIEVETATSASEALDYISALGFDVVITDLFIPDLGGAKVLAAVRLFDPLLPVVIITGDGARKGALDALDDPALYFLEKPIENQRLIDLVCELARARQASRATA
jgi:DNA-binding NtrC family response regulator